MTDLSDAAAAASSLTEPDWDDCINRGITPDNTNATGVGFLGIIDTAETGGRSTEKVAG